MSSSRNELRLDWCSTQAARYAVEHWHYSRSMPASKTLKIGVWESGHFIGVIIFSRGANRFIGTPYGLKMTQCCELTRVALDSHSAPVTRMVSIALKMLKRRCPGIRLVVSYADCDQEHHGGIYVAGNWIYVGKVERNGGTPRYRVFGKVMHGRSVHARWGRGAQNVEWLRANVDPRAEHVLTRGKHKYLYPLDRAMRRQIEPLAKPYPEPERRGRGVTGCTPGDQPGSGGSNPTRPLVEALACG